MRGSDWIIWQDSFWMNCHVFFLESIVRYLTTIGAIRFQFSVQHTLLWTCFFLNPLKSVSKYLRNRRAASFSIQSSNLKFIPEKNRTQTISGCLGLHKRINFWYDFDWNFNNWIRSETVPREITRLFWFLGAEMRKNVCVIWHFKFFLTLFRMLDIDSASSPDSTELVFRADSCGF